MLTHFSLFTGIGGLDLAAEWAGFTTVGQCEWWPYAKRVLKKHWPDVQRWGDIRSVTKESFYERTGLSTVDVISGGFPCQPFSVAGKRKGNEDDRYLWPEMLRVAETLRPRWVVGENVAGIVTMALDQVLSDLENINYTCEAVIIPACSVNAPHKRDRTFILAWDTNRNNLDIRTVGEISGRKDSKPTGICNDVANTDNGQCIEPVNEIQARRITASACGKNVANSLCKRGCSRNNQRENAIYVNSCSKAIRARKNIEWWAIEPDVGRVANGIPNRVDRLKCLGNAVVPQQAYPIFQAIADIERSS